MFKELVKKAAQGHAAHFGGADFLINFSLWLFFGFILLFKLSYQLAPLLAGALSIARLWQGKFLKGWAAFVFVVCLLYFALELLFFILFREPISSLEASFKMLLLSLLALAYTKFNVEYLLLCINVGAIVAGLVALRDRLILGLERAFDNGLYMPIEAGDIAMSLALFSLAIAFYRLARGERYLALVAFGGFGFGLWASLASMSRGGWLGLPVALLILCFVYRALLRYFVLAVALGALLLYFSPFMHKLKLSVNNIALYQQGQKDSSIGLRFEMWRGAALAFLQSPLGSSKSGAQMQRKLQAQSGVISEAAGDFKHAHNEFINTALELGVLGLVLKLAMFAPVFYFFSILQSSVSDEKRLLALLGLLHLVLVFIYCQSQSFFSHNIGVTFYFFTLSVLLANSQKPSLR